MLISLSKKTEFGTANNDVRSSIARWLNRTIATSTHIFVWGYSLCIYQTYVK